jgi:DNA-binding MarR family transcriptional regulator
MPKPVLHKEDAASIGTLLNVLDAFREIDKDMPLQQVVLFLSAAKEDGMSLQEICQKYDLAQSTASRNLALLAGIDPKRPDRNQPLVRAFENPMNRRTKIIEPTPEGRQLLNKVLRLLRKAAHA